jgi:hypothetical protein
MNTAASASVIHHAATDQSEPKRLDRGGLKSRGQVSPEIQLRAINEELSTEANAAPFAAKIV